MEELKQPTYNGPMYDLQSKDSLGCIIDFINCCISMNEYLDEFNKKEIPEDISDEEKEKIVDEHSKELNSRIQWMNQMNYCIRFIANRYEQKMSPEIEEQYKRLIESDTTYNYVNNNIVEYSKVRCLFWNKLQNRNLIDMSKYNLN